MISSSALEALLFAHGEPLAESRLAELLACSLEELQEVLTRLRDELSHRGVRLRSWQGMHELVTAPESAPVVALLREGEAKADLSKTALETLAFFLYTGSKSRPELEEIRGMYSHQILRSLLLKGLIAETGEERVGQVVYDVTPLCLQWLGIEDRSRLPALETLGAEPLSAVH
ncbi:MAG: segregation and condensation protein [Patescibacteria group bacterium]|nr:segregation and condensation protein [Patescibacteria group bacterium]